MRVERTKSLANSSYTVSRSLHCGVRLLDVAVWVLRAWYIVWRNWFYGFFLRCSITPQFRCCIWYSIYGIQSCQLYLILQKVHWKFTNISMFWLKHLPEYLILTLLKVNLNISLVVVQNLPDCKIFSCKVIARCWQLWAWRTTPPILYLLCAMNLRNSSEDLRGKIVVHVLEPSAPYEAWYTQLLLSKINHSCLKYLLTILVDLVFPHSQRQPSYWKPASRQHERRHCENTGIWSFYQWWVSLLS